MRKVLIMRKERIIMRKRKNCGGINGMAKKLSVNIQPAAVIGKPVK